MKHLEAHVTSLFQGGAGGGPDLSWAEVGMGKEGWLSPRGEDGGLRGHSRNTYAEEGGIELKPRRAAPRVSYHLHCNVKEVGDF